MRRMLTAAFAIKRIETLRPAIQRIADRLIDDMLAGPTPVDLVSAFALPLPSSVICELLGVPYADHEFFQTSSRILLNSATTPEQARCARRQLTDYLDGLLGQRLAQARDDLLSELAARVYAGELTRHAAATTAGLLLVAGHETTANMIALGTLALLQHPEQLAALRATDDPALIAAAVEELLRYLSIVQSGRRRVALEDIPIGGRTIRAGEGVILATEVANRDASVFADPDRLDVHRDARGHMAFGFGVHQCLGQPLARLELQVVYGTLFRRIPTLRPAVRLDEIPFKHDSLVYGVYELPVSWSSGKERPMKVKVDQARCVASGNCVLTAPEVFDQRDEDGIVVLLDPSPPRRARRARAPRRGALPGARHQRRGLGGAPRPAVPEQGGDGPGVRCPRRPARRGWELTVSPERNQ